MFLLALARALSLRRLFRIGRDLALERGLSMICYESIGTVRSPFKEVAGMPIQPLGAIGVQGIIDIHPRLADGLKDLEGFSHIFLLYHLHRTAGFSLIVKPFLDKNDHGVFATRVPKRPNSIGLSVLKLLRVEGTSVHVENIDILDGTPVLDIKPYVPEFDVWNADRVGWFEGRARNAEHHRSDGRFQLNE
jgi:tRNA (adenine37-N6)-methyltransferase